MTQTNNNIAKTCQMLTEKAMTSIGRVVIGKSEVTKRMLICLLAGGHVLIEDVPGIGKTTIVNALAKSVQLDFQRIQFTPDLMPSDVTGFNIYNPKLGEFIFRKGAVMTQILLADEINRSSPRTQSSLLEAMQEEQVTVEGHTYDLPDPFMVLATQNPVEHVGTYPLPEAQMDRFMMRLSIGYPEMAEELQILTHDSASKIRNEVEPVVTADEIRWMRAQVRNVKVSDAVKRYIVALCRATREHEDVELGVSPRASQMLVSAASVLALMQGRDYIIPDDVQALAHDVLDHRIILKPQARGKGARSADIVEAIIKNTAVPK